MNWADTEGKIFEKHILRVITDIAAGNSIRAVYISPAGLKNLRVQLHQKISSSFFLRQLRPPEDIFLLYSTRFGSHQKISSSPYFPEDTAFFIIIRHRRHTRRYHLLYSIFPRHLRHTRRHRLLYIIFPRHRRHSRRNFLLYILYPLTPPDENSSRFWIFVLGVLISTR